MATYWVQIIIICCFFRFSLGCSSQKSPDPPKCPTTKGPAELTRGLGDSTVDGKGVLGATLAWKMTLNQTFFVT